jgi:hypothetical protein
MFCGGENSFCITSGLCITQAMIVQYEKIKIIRTQRMSMETSEVIQ